MAKFGTGVARGFEKTFPTGLQIGASAAGKRQDLEEKQKDNENLADVIDNLKFEGSDTISDALRNNKINSSVAVNLIGKKQTGQFSPKEVKAFEAIGIKLGGIPDVPKDKAVLDKAITDKKPLGGDVTKSLIDKQTTPLDDSTKGEFKLGPEQTVGGLKFEREGAIEEKLKEETAITEAKKKVETRAKLDVAQRNALNNLDLTTGAFTEMATTYSDAVREGGMGSKLNEIKAAAKLWAGGRQAEDLPNTAAWPGQKTEVIARMMPMLTQQGEKPGSVRLVATVFDKLALTVPTGNTPPKNARKMLEKSIRNMYRFTRAAARLGITNESVEGLSQDVRETLSNRVANLANTMQIVGTEKEQVDNLINSVLSPIDTLIAERGDEKQSAFGFHTGDTTKIDGVLYERGKDGKWLPKKSF